MKDKKIAQTNLIRLGLLDPPADGVWGKQSQAALEHFQIEYGLQEGDLSAVQPKALNCGSDLAGRIVSYMMKQGYWLPKGGRLYSIVYLEGANADGAPNPDRFNEWNDRRIILEVDEKPQIVGNWLATTEPGATYTYNPMNPGGAFRIAFGQYKAWQFGLHGRTQYPALVQCNPVRGHRDKNKDGLRTADSLVEGLFGINQHHGWDEGLVNGNSAGCLVGQSIEGHRSFLKFLKTDRRYQVNPDYRFYTTIIAADQL